MVSGIGYKAYNFTCVGASHKRSGKPCQDASLSVNKPEYILTAVCDGHGGDDYFRSDKGSDFAVKAVASCVGDKDFLPMLRDAAGDPDRVNDMLIQLEKSIISTWNDMVNAHYKANPFTLEELENVSPRTRFYYSIGDGIECAYGTTMIANVVTDSFWFGMHIGDGECVEVDGTGHYLHPIPADDACVYNYTTSICDRKAIYNMRHHFSTNMPDALFIGSDGVDNCFADAQKLHDFYAQVKKSFTEQEESIALLDLIEYLPRMSQKGSGDDISIGIIVQKA